MNINRISSFVKELKTYGEDVVIITTGNTVIMTSSKTSLRKLTVDLDATAAYYGMKMRLKGDHECDFYSE